MLARLTSDRALQRLGAIEHVVVLMMESRSFDQMLGYRRLAGDGAGHRQLPTDFQD